MKDAVCFQQSFIYFLSFGFASNTHIVIYNATKNKQQQQQQQQLAIDPSSMKHKLLATLSSPLLSAGKAASQAVAAVAEAEMPQGQWDGLIPFLKNNVSSPDSNTRECTLQTIGYVCETIVSLYCPCFICCCFFLSFHVD
jgi:hypothetical protein